MASPLPANILYFYGVGGNDKLIFATVATVLTQGGLLQAFISNDKGEVFYELYVRAFAGHPHSYNASLINPHGKDIVRLGASRYGEYVALGDGVLLKRGSDRNLAPRVHVLRPGHRRLCEDTSG